MPKVSIILPCYKVEKFLPFCLDSLINQTEKDFEVICVDDGSPDNSGQILEEYAAKDSRFKVIHQQNGGISVARNSGIALISAPYTLFVDSDDALHPQTVELTLKTAEETKADIVWFDVCSFSQDTDLGFTPLCFEHTTPTKHYPEPLTLYAVKPLYHRDKAEKLPGVVWNKLYRSELVKDTFFEPGLALGEDNLYTLEIMAKANSLEHLKLPLYCYRCNPNSIMQNLNKEKIVTNLTKEMNGYLNMQKRIIDSALSEKKKGIVKRFVASFYFKRLFRPLVKKSDLAADKLLTESLLLGNELYLNTLGLHYRIPMALYKRKLLNKRDKHA